MWPPLPPLLFSTQWFELDADKKAFATRAAERNLP
jgi:hypothetical protein